MASDPSRRMFDLEVTMEGKEPFVITTDQRDQAAFELQPFGVSFGMIRSVESTFARWTAWHMLHRTGQTKLTWEKWTKECVLVRDAPEVPAPNQPEGSDDNPPARGRSGARAAT